MIGLRTADEDVVVTRGDFTLDNILVSNDGEVTGCVDWGRAGVAEFGSNGPEEFLRHYGITEPGRRKLRVFGLLDEFF